MRVALATLALLLAGLAGGPRAHASDFLYGPALRAIAAAGQELHKGQPRAAVLKKLEEGLAKSKYPRWRALGERLAQDLRFSIAKEERLARTQAALREQPERFLMDTTMRRHKWRFTSDWQLHLDRWMKANPEDPAVLLLQEDREVIGRLIPYLTDRSPSRSPDSAALEGEVPHQLRVCDMAMQVITYHSRCRWFDEASFREPFHTRTAEVQAKAIAQLEAWWAANKDKSIETGIRARYDDAGFYGKTWMAEQLIRLGDEREDAQLRPEGLDRLHALARLQRPDLPFYAARRLAIYGEIIVPVMNAWLVRARDVPGNYVQTAAVFYVAQYGERDSWDLILQLASREVREGVQRGHSSLLQSLGNIHSPKEPRWAVPILGLLLRRTQNTGSRGIGASASQAFSKADVATERIQRLTGQDFGYRRKATQADRSGAIERARAWWKREGRAKWTLDAIDGMRAAGK